MHSNGMKRSLFSLLGVKTGGGGKRESFMDILSRGRGCTGGAASQRAQEKSAFQGGQPEGGQRNSARTILCQATPSGSYHCILVGFEFPS